jgi:hypothetical protein
LPEEYDAITTSYFNLLKRRYSIPETVNFHATDFFERPVDAFEEKVSEDKIREFCFSLGEFIQTIPMYIFAHAIRKNDLRTYLKIPPAFIEHKKKTPTEDRDVAYEILIRHLLLEYGNFLSKEDALGLVTAESRREADQVLLRAYIYALQPSRYKSNPKYFALSNEARQRIISLSFENKQVLTGGLEIADLSAYMIHKMLQNFLNKMETRGGLDLWIIMQKKLYTPYLGHSLILSKKDIMRVAADRICKISDQLSKKIGSETLQKLPKG